MHTVTIEILRTGESHSHELSEKTKYIALCGSHPHVDLTIDCNQTTFSKYKKMLRYFESDEQQRQKGILFFEQLITKIFDDIVPLRVEGQTEDWLHLRLVITPRELAQLPFELALTPEGLRGHPLKRFLLNPQRLTTLTREVRQVGTLKYNWPYKPRILFAWASPNAEVPYREHSDALIEIVKHFARPIKNSAEPVPDIAPLITFLKQASLRSIKENVRAAVEEGNPYTYIHLLAHGSSAGDSETEIFKLLLHDDNDVNPAHETNGEELANALLAVNGNQTFFPAIVSVMACDSSNEGSLFLPAGSLAHQLHRSGVPCVFASQFPLSVEGSVNLVSTLYKRLLIDRDDPRIALYHARNDLFKSAVHDWASLVAYVRFPENIDEQLKDNHLKILLQSLKTANAWSEHLLRYKDEMAPEKKAVWFENVSKQLDEAIKDLEDLLKSDIHQKKERFTEHYGLLGSTFKRKAEHFYRMATFQPQNAESLLAESKKALSFSKVWYQRGFEKQMNHWNAVQYLSLAAITEGNISSSSVKDIWTISKLLAEMDGKENNDTITRIWAWGSLAELWLLAPLRFQADEKGSLADETENALFYLKKIARAEFDFIEKLPEIGQDLKFARESTFRQFERYIGWWPEVYKSAGVGRLKELATEITEKAKL
jgi:hypothetical protein